MAFVLCSSSIMGAETFEFNGLNYQIFNGIDECGVISGSYSGDIVIPTSVVYNEREYEVTEIGVSAFSGCQDITSVVIGNAVRGIYAQLHLMVVQACYLWK